MLQQTGHAKQSLRTVTRVIVSWAESLCSLATLLLAFTHTCTAAAAVSNTTTYAFNTLPLQVEPITLRIPLPKSGFSAPNLPELNHSQLHAVRSVLQQPLSLIQVCPPL